MVRISYEGTIPEIKQAAAAANQVLEQDDFYQTIRHDFQPQAGQVAALEIATCLKHCRLELQLKTYQEVQDNSRGYRMDDQPGILYINTAGSLLKDSKALFAGTLIQEAALQCMTNSEGVSKNQEDARKVASWIGNLAMSWINTPEKTEVPHQSESSAEKEGLAEPLELWAQEPFNFRLTVTIFGGERPPTNLEVTLKGPSGPITVLKEKSFTLEEHLLAGAYDLRVKGSNPEEGWTEFVLSGAFDGKPDPSAKETKKGNFYTAKFSFIILPA